jgi:hypothetical protein
VVEPLVLPEPFDVQSGDLARPVRRPPFELLQARLQTGRRQLEEQVQVAGHDDVFEHVPDGPAAVGDRLGHDAGDFGNRQVTRRPGPVEPRLHFGVDAAVQG